jgi:hypothetical protein
LKNITDYDRFFDAKHVVYRFHINDWILFKNSINASMGSVGDIAAHCAEVIKNSDQVLYIGSA